MNILPKKSWHVRKKENVWRVRKDEKKAAEEEQCRLDKIQKAEHEFKINQLRNKKGGDAGCCSKTLDSIFSQNEIEHTTTTTNKDYQKEKNAEVDKHESKLGIKKYFAEDTNEFKKTQSWYEKPSAKMEKSWKSIEELRSKKDVEQFQEALYDQIRKLKDKKRKKRKHSSSESEPESEGERLRKKRDLYKLRHERLMREKGERTRQNAVLGIKEEKEVKKPETQKYNNMFNPEFARKRH
uniref:Cir_N domain-containing protein n=1 Tax=Rhabditophanes sp. KR3021 TaxID=114890 RepID=A0AC35TQM1_9BILA